jgi:uncharacterized membrane protein YphA (DoxX/SURF4 family)
VERLYRRLRRQASLRAFTVVTRILLASGFIPPGLTKLLRRRFTLIPPNDRIGAFFDAFFQAPAFYVFVGTMQVLAGVLLLIPRTAFLGALLYLPIIANIFVITVSMGFRGTWLITGLMLLANLYLIVWDLPRLRGIVGQFSDPFGDTGS